MKNKNKPTPKEENIFEYIFENIPDGVLITDIQTKSFKMGNPSICRMLGYTKNEFLNIDLYKIHPKESIPLIEKLFNQLLNEEIEIAKDIPVLTKDGTLLYVDITAKPLQYNKKIHLLGIFRNITERKEAENKFRQTQEVLITTLNATADGILLVDNQDKISHINRQFVEMWNIPQDIIDSRDDRQMIRSVLYQLTDPNGFVNIFKKFYDNQLKGFDEIRFKDGKVFESYTAPVLIEGVRIGRVWDYRDITKSKHAEEALQKTATELKLIFKNMLNAFVIWESVFDKNGKYISFRFGFFNEAYARISKLKLEDVKGKDIFKVWPDTEQSWVEAYGSVAVTGNPYTFDMYHKATRGWYHCNAYRPADSPSQVCVIFEDITERKLAEDALKKSETLLSSIFEASPAGILLLVKRVPIKVNRSFCSITGYSQEELFGRTTRQLYFSDEEYNIVGEAYSERKSKGLSMVETRFRRKDGSVMHTLISLSYINPDDEEAGDIAVCFDITDLKKAELALKESEAVLKSLFNAAPIGIAILNDRMHIKVNSSLCKITGYPESELVGMNSSDLYINNQEYEKTGEKLYGKMKENGLGIAESHFKRKDGTIIDVILCISPLDINNISNGVVGTVLDVSDLKKIEAEKSRLEQMLVHSQKMEAIGTMAGGIAHDFNNILAGIFGYSELSLNVDGNPPQTEEYIRQIIKASERARDLVTRILIFSRQTDLALKPVLPKQIIEEAVKFLRASIPAIVELKEILKSNSVIMAEPTMLHQVIINLCNNAIYAMKSRPGVIEIGLDDMLVDKDFARMHTGIMPGRHIIIRVSDTGSGIAPEILGHIFEPFFTTKPQGEGTGLGLSVAHGIIKKLSGIITVESEVGKGSIFSVIIPAADDKEIEIDRSDSIIKGGTEKILLIDDEEIIIKTLSTILGELGYQVKAFTDCLEALDEYKNNSAGYDLIITDYSMPHMTGIEMLKEIKEIKKDIPVILTSGYLDKAMEENALKEGVSLVLAKPISTFQIADAVRKAMAGGKQ
ncbi:MAG: PAS domain S-box protein [Spirochaetota bacterium]